MLRSLRSMHKPISFATLSHNMVLRKHTRKQVLSPYLSGFVVPASPRKSTVSVDDSKTSRSQVFGFAVTNKVKGATFKAVLGLGSVQAKNNLNWELIGVVLRPALFMFKYLVFRPYTVLDCCN